jgi:hypothetical protein
MSTRRSLLVVAVGVLAAAGLTAGLLISTGAAGAASTTTSTTQVSAPNGYHACVDPTTYQLKDSVGRPDIWPNDAAHPLFCSGNRLLEQYASLEQAQKALSAADPSQHVLANGPYPGATHLQYGDNSTAKWVGDSGATEQNSWVSCPPGGIAMGGGFVAGADAGAADKNIQVTISAPTQVQAGKLLFNGLNGGETPIAGNPDMAIQPNAWVVEGYNNGTADLIVRPYVVCWAPALH